VRGVSVGGRAETESTMGRKRFCEKEGFKAGGVKECGSCRR